EGKDRPDRPTKRTEGPKNNGPSYTTTNHYRAPRHYTVTEHTMSPEVLVMSRKAWESLSVEDQAIFREAAQESARFMRQQWKSWEERAREQARQAGCLVITEFNKQPFMDAMSEIYDKFLGDPKLRTVVERIRQAE